NRLWKTNFSIEQISALKEFLGKKLGAEHILFKLINDDASWLNDLNSLINLTGKDFPSKVFDFKVSEQDIDGKFTVTLPSFSNGLQIASYLEVLSYNLLTFVEEFLTFSLAENLDNRLTVYDIPEQLRNKSAAVRFKVGVKEGIDISQFKNDAKFSKIYRSGQQQYQLRDKFRESRFGKVKPIIHSEYNGKKAIVVGNTVHFGDWKTFIDFLYDYLKIKFGKDWWRNEATKPEDSCSPVMNWARQYFIHQRQHSTKEDGLFCIDPNGPMHAYLSLAYDLFILEDNQKLQETLIARMRQPNKSNFMGARYEATVASIFIKAGFDIEYEDESDSSEKHPEFIAIHKNTGERIAVEAKKRNRGAITESDNEAQRGITGLLKDAISKFKGIPYIIFMELGLPPIDGNPMEKPWIKKLLDTQNLSGMRDAEGKDCCNMVVFTNYPTEHPEEISKFPKHSYIVSQSLVPKVEIKNRFHLQEIVAVLDKQSQIPSWFDE
ncbi:MAG: hypothetical protein NTY22_09230, partial [Proteobacteria bacterium]|nr:hypothetical protein [Pseudomonadota bacterium]